MLTMFRFVLFGAKTNNLSTWAWDVEALGIEASFADAEAACNVDG